MRNAGFLFVLLLSFLLTVPFNCGDTTDQGEDSLVRVQLTDAPGLFDSVNVTVSEVSIHRGEGEEDSGEWTSFTLEATEFNLMNLQNGQTAVMGEEHLEPGIYSQIRLKIDEASVFIDGGEGQTLDVPSGAKSGLKINLQAFEIEAGLEYDLVVDFDAARSVVVKGPKANPTGYSLKPVIRATFEANTGAIEGSIADVSDLPTVIAIAGADTVAGSIPDPSTSEFILSYLPAGTYTVVAEDTTGARAEVADVEVTVGQVNDVGELTLAE
jgi:hypothetical protein